MAKIIEFLAPIEAMRGDLSGGNKPRYGQNGNQTGFEAPGKALHYDKKYIGAKRLFMGTVKKGFSLRTRTTFSADSRIPAAVLGGGASVANAAFKNLAITAQLVEIFDAERRSGLTGNLSPRGWLTKKCMVMVQEKDQSVTVSAVIGMSTVSVTINNPWITGGTGTDVNVPAEVLQKFSPYLSQA